MQSISQSSWTKMDRLTWGQGALTSRTRARRRVARDFMLRAAEPLELRVMMDVTLSSVGTAEKAAGKDLYIALPGNDTANGTLTYTAQSDNSNVSVKVLPPEHSLRLNVSGTDSLGQAFSGNLTLQLFEDKAPQTTTRIEQLVNNHFYDNLTFHRIIDGFVAQGGDPKGDGSGGSGVTLNDEFDKTLTFTSKGLLAMANSGSDTSDSQFFITDTKLTLAKEPQALNFRYTIFGILTSGFDLYQKIITTPVGTDGQTPTHKVTINAASVFVDTRNAVLEVSSPTGFTGNANLAVTATSSVSGGVNSAQETVPVVVQPDTHNDPAFLGSVTAQTTTAGLPVSFDVQGFDLQNDQLTFAVKDPTGWTGTSTGSDPTNVTVSISTTQANGSTPATAHITLTPKADFTGTVNLLVGVRDQTNRGGSGAVLDSRTNFDTQKLTLTVNAAVTKALDDSYTIATDSGANQLTVLANDSAAKSAGALTITTTSAPSHGTVAIATDGNSLTFRPAGGYSGPDSFTYTVKDANNATSTATVSLNIEGVRVLRAVNPNNGDNLYTVSTAEFTSAVSKGYQDQATNKAGFAIPTTQLPNSDPIFRLYNTLAGLHYSTLSAGESHFLMNLVPLSDPDSAKAGWKLESSSTFMFGASQTGTAEILHLYNQSSGVHLFTQSTTDRDSTLASDTHWVQQTSLGFAFPVPSSDLKATASAAASSSPEHSAAAQVGTLANSTGASGGTQSSSSGLTTTQIATATSGTSSTSTSTDDDDSNDDSKSDSSGSKDKDTETPDTEHDPAHLDSVFASLPAM